MSYIKESHILGLPAIQIDKYESELGLLQKKL